MQLYFMLLAHLLYDFHWQGSFIADNKGKRLFLLFIHAITWAMFVSSPLIYFQDSEIVVKCIFLFTTHFVIDYWKSHQPRSEETFYLIYIDQGLHLISILLCCFL